MPELDTRNSSGDWGDTVFVSKAGPGILAILLFGKIANAFIVSETDCPLVILQIIRNHHATFAAWQEFSPLHTETPHISDCPDPFAFIGCAVSVRAVFNHEDIVTLCNFHNGVHLRWHSTEMDDNDRFRVGRDSPLDIFRISASGERVNIAEDRNRLTGENGHIRPPKRCGGGDNFIAGSHPNAEQCPMNRSGPVVVRQGILDTVISGKFLLKLVDGI